LPGKVEHEGARILGVHGPSTRRPAPGVRKAVLEHLDLDAQLSQFLDVARAGVGRGSLGQERG
jgi:hypothetical protein